MKDETGKLKQSQSAKRKSLAEWRAGRVQSLDLPSGLTVTVRDVSMTDLLLSGKLPPAFADFAEQANKNGANSIDLKELMANAADFTKMLDTLVTLALVEPKIGEFADDETVTLAEIPSGDKMAVFNWVNREVTQLTSFREG